MRVSAVGFLFQEKTKGKGLSNPKNYTCTIHKLGPDGQVSRNFISSPVNKINTTDIVSPDTAMADIMASLLKISSKNSKSKFQGATIKEGIKETEIHAVISDKLFAVRTRDEFGKNRIRIMGKNSAGKLVAKNLHINA